MMDSGRPIRRSIPCLRTLDLLQHIIPGRLFANAHMGFGERFGEWMGLFEYCKSFLKILKLQRQADFDGRDLSRGVWSDVLPIGGVKLSIEVCKGWVALCQSVVNEIDSGLLETDRLLRHGCRISFLYTRVRMKRSSLAQGCGLWLGKKSLTSCETR